MIKFFKKHWEVLSYLIFRRADHPAEYCAVCAVQPSCSAIPQPTAGAMCWITLMCILFAYCTNRAFVFRSKTHGQGHGKRIWHLRHLSSGHHAAGHCNYAGAGQPAGCAGCSADGRAAMQGVLSVVAHWLGPDTALQMADLLCREHMPAGVTDGSAAIAVIGGADGPTAIFVTSRLRCAGTVGPCREGLFQCTGDRAELCVQQADHL